MANEDLQEEIKGYPEYYQKIILLLDEIANYQHKNEEKLDLLQTEIKKMSRLLEDIEMNTERIS